MPLAIQHTHLQLTQTSLHCHSREIFLSVTPFPRTSASLRFKSAMKVQSVLSICLMALCASSSPVTTSAETLEARQFNWGNIDWGCTFSCSIWNYCRVRNTKNLQPCGNGMFGFLRLACWHPEYMNGCSELVEGVVSLADYIHPSTSSAVRLPMQHFCLGRLRDIKPILHFHW